MEKQNVIHENISPSELTNVNFCTYIDDCSYTPNHWHRSIEIKYMLEGTIFNNLEGKTYKLVPGKCIVINSNVIHSDKPMEYSRYILLHVPLNFLEKFMPDVRNLRFDINEDDNDSQNLEKINKLKKMLLRMKTINENKEKGFLLEFNSLLFGVLSMLYNEFSRQVIKTHLETEQKDFDRLDKILQYINENYNRPIALDEIANVVVFSPAYFCRFFKRYMGTSFLEYQNEIRLSFIYRDIIGTKEPVYKILEKHGFTNYKIFRRMFNEHFGTTPLKIRQHILEHHL